MFFSRPAINIYPHCPQWNILCLNVTSGPVEIGEDLVSWKYSNAGSNLWLSWMNTYIYKYITTILVVICHLSSFLPLLLMSLKVLERIVYSLSSQTPPHWSRCRGSAVTGSLCAGGGELHWGSVMSWQLGPGGENVTQLVCPRNP